MPSDVLPPLSLSELARCGSGRLVGEDAVFDGVSIDTRQLKPGMLFVALQGERADGHDYAATAAQLGASGLLVTRELGVSVPQVVVPDTLAALVACARARRRAFGGGVIGVTGSNGKTTSKEMLGAMVSLAGPCLVTFGNLNNHIGVPLTLLRLEDAHRYAVIEMGANHRGEIAHLASIAEPVVGLVTNAGAAHLEGFGSLEGVASGKGELFASLPANGTAVINADDRFAPAWREMVSRARILTFGLDTPADFMAHQVAVTMEASGPVQTFDLESPAGSATGRLHLAGRHNLRNALGAAAAAYAAGVSLEHLLQGLGDVTPVKGRLQVRHALNGATLIDDSYNANPGSLGAGLDALALFKGRHWLVLGDMMELGERSDELHAEVGRAARSSGVDRLLAFGVRAKLAAETFGSGGSWFENIDELIAEARKGLAPGIAVLIKGSRANRLERVTAALAAPNEDKETP